MGRAQRTAPFGRYRRDRFTWSAFAALLSFGFLNAVLGPALPYLRTVEHIGYLLGALHQVAFAVGGGLAGFVATKEGGCGRAWVVRLGLIGAAAASLGIGYGDAYGVTLVAAFLVSLLGTSAMVRLWAALADAHPWQRTTALTEGEVAVSLGGILCPLLVSGLAGTWLSWRFAFVLGAVLVVAAAALVWRTSASPPTPRSEQRPAPAPGWWGDRAVATLVTVFSVVALEFSLSFWLASYLDDSVGLPRRAAVVMVSGLYVAHVTGRLIVSRLSRHLGTAVLLTGALAAALAGTPLLLAATNAPVAGAGVVVTGAGIGASFPLASSLHVGASRRGTDGALGRVFSTAAVGQVVGPLAAGVIGQLFGLRLGLLVLPALALLGLAALGRATLPTGRALRPGTVDR